MGRVGVGPLQAIASGRCEAQPPAIALGGRIGQCSLNNASLGREILASLGLTLPRLKAYTVSALKAAG
jgi:hypothetical protein